MHVVSSDQMSKEVYEHLKKIYMKGYVQFREKFETDGIGKLNDFVHYNVFNRGVKYYQDNNNGLYLIYGINEEAFCTKFATTQYLMGLSRDEVNIIKTLIHSKFSNLFFDVVINTYDYNNRFLVVLWFAHPDIVAKMKRNGELFFRNKAKSEVSTEINSQSTSEATKPNRRFILKKKPHKNLVRHLPPKKTNLTEKSVSDSQEHTHPNTSKKIIEKQIVVDEINPKVNELIKLIGNEELSRAEIMNKLGIVKSSRKLYNENYYKPAENLGFVEKTIPDKPNSKNQKYRLTLLGQEKLTPLAK